MPKRLTREDATASGIYAKFIAEPFETGYGHTVGNSLRRVLLSSLEGAAITSITQTKPILVTFALPQTRLPELRAEMAKHPITVTATLRDAGDAAIAADQEGRALDSHVFAAVQALFDPDVIGQRHRAFDIGAEPTRPY